MSDLAVKTYFKEQSRSETIKIKPGLKEIANIIAGDLFPCALVSADDSIEFLISMYAQSNNIQLPTLPSSTYVNNIKPNEVDPVLNQLYNTAPVISNSVETDTYETIGSLDAGQIDFN